MSDELWLKKIKERLDDCSEPLPPGGWERLQRELDKAAPAVVPHRSRLVMMRRWSVAAAASALVAVAAVSLWLLQSPVGQEVRRAEVPVVTQPDEIPGSVPENEQLALASEIPSRTKNSRTVVPVNVAAVPVSEAAENIETKEGEDVIETVPVVDVPEVEDVAVPKEEKKESVRRSTPKKTSLDEPRVISRSQKREDGWSFGLSVGNRSGSSDGGDKDLIYDSGPGGLVQGSNINLSATTNGVIAIPGEQELTFKDGMPYVLKRSDEPVDAKHRQPVSVGFSVRKNLGHGLSVESGLMYTYLYSDLYFGKGNNSVEQKLHYLGIPLRVNWNFVDTRKFSVYLSAGGAIEKCVYGKLGDEKQTVDPVQLSVLGALGAQYNLSRRWGLYIEPGISYYFDDGSKVQTIRKERPCSFTLQAGLRLTY